MLAFGLLSRSPDWLPIRDMGIDILFKYYTRIFNIIFLYPKVGRREVSLVDKYLVLADALLIPSTVADAIQPHSCTALHPHHVKNITCRRLQQALGLISVC